MQIRPAAKTRNRQTTFYVDSDSGATYIVHNKRHTVSHRKVWTCNCPDFTERRQFNGTQCKHIDTVQAQIRLDSYATAAYAASAQAQAQTPVTNVRQLLDTIVTVLNGPRTEAKQLWDILTALRGPDSDSSDLKDLTTARIRGAIRLNHGNGGGAIVSNDKPFGSELNLNTPYSDAYRKLVTDLMNEHSAQAHFANHYRAALLALKKLGYIK
jgi:hypothetical protein